MLLIGLALMLSLPARGSAAAEPASRPAEAERAAFAAGLAAFRGGDWRAAAGGFRAAARREGLLADYARFFLAEAQARQGLLALARRTAEGLVSRYPSSRLVPRTLLQAASWASRQGNESAAGALLRQFLTGFPGHDLVPLARYVLGLSLEGRGEGLEAARVFRELWLTAPATPYGQAASDRLDLLAAAGVSLPPPTTLERVERAERLVAGGLAASARQEAEALLAELPDPGLTLRGLRVMTAGWRRGGRYDVAARAAERALGEAPAPRRAPLLLELGRLQQRAGGRELALATFERLAREHPATGEAAEALFQSGRLLEEVGRMEEAAAAYRGVTAGFPEHHLVPGALWRLGWLAYLRSDFLGAAAEFGRLGALPVAGGYRYAAAYWAGRALEAAGERARAGQIFELVSAEVPGTYYGILAGRRAPGGKAAAAPAGPVALPQDPFAPLADDEGFQKATALSGLGLGEFAVAELEGVVSRSLAEPTKLYASAAAFARELRHDQSLRILRRFFQDLAASGDRALPRAFWELFYPLAWRRDLEEAASRAGVDPLLVAAVVREESSFFPEARSPAGARGLMQLMPETARALAAHDGLAVGDGDVLDDPRPNLRLGTAYLASLLAEFPDPRLAAAAYNAGPGRVRQWWQERKTDDMELWVEQIPFDETRHFVKRVTVSWEEYRRLYRGAASGPGSQP